MRFFKSSEHIRKKVDGPYFEVSAKKKPHQYPCNDFATKARGNLLQVAFMLIGFAYFWLWFSNTFYTYEISIDLICLGPCISIFSPSV